MKSRNGYNRVMVANKTAIKVGVVENDENYRSELLTELERVPEISRVEAWESAEAYWRDRKGRKLDLLLLDIRLPGMDGVELAGKVSDRDPETSIVMLSNLNSDNLTFQALRNGAVGYLLKSELQDIGETVRNVLDGGATITPSIAFRVLTSFRKADPVKEARLTPRETQILELMVTGITLNEVAGHVGSSPHTVRNQAKSIYKKLNVHNRMQLAQKAAAAGLLKSEIE